VTRKQVLSVAAVIFAAFLLALSLVVLMPLWLPAVVVNPRLLNPLADKLMKGFTREATKLMFKGLK
jgi:hypothetical protein